MGWSSTLADVDRCLGSAHTLQASLQIADGIITVVTIVHAERRQQQLDAQLRRQREDARDQIERNATIASTEIVDGVDGEPGWRARSDAALEMLRERLGLTGDDTAIDDLLRTVAAQQQLVSDLQALVAPQLSAGHE